MPGIFRSSSAERTMNAIPSPSSSSSSSLQEVAYTGSHKVPFRPGKEFDYEADSDDVPLDIDLVMPPHRQRNQPEHHRSTMRLCSSAQIMRAKVCRHALNRNFRLAIEGGETTDIVLWLPSNFTGSISVRGAEHASYSRAFAERVLPRAQLDLSDFSSRPARTKGGDGVEIRTGGRIAFRVWDVLSGVAEAEVDRSEGKESRHRSTGSAAVGGWRRMFGAASRPRSKTTKEDPRIDWDFLIEDQI